MAHTKISISNWSWCDGAVVQCIMCTYHCGKPCYICCNSGTGTARVWYTVHGAVMQWCNGAVVQWCIRPFKVDCLFCIHARVGFTVLQTKTHTSCSSCCTEYRTFFGLKIRPLEAEWIAFKDFWMFLGEWIYQEYFTIESVKMLNNN